MSRYTPSLYGALTLARAGMSNIPAGAFFASMAEDAHGSAWPWQGAASYSGETREARTAYDDAFKTAFGDALRSSGTADGAIRDLVGELRLARSHRQAPSASSPGSRPWIGWGSEPELSKSA